MASRFWVGGTGTWSASNTTNWAATSGGAGGQSVPGPSDTVTFDGASGTSFTVTIESGYNPSVTSVAGGSATVTLDINNQTLTVQTFTFSNPTNVARTLAFGSTGQITVTGNGASVFSVQTDTGLTTTGSRNVVFTYSGGVGTRTIGTNTFANLNSNSLNYYVQGGTDIVTFGGASGIIVRNLDMTGFSGTFSTNIVRAAGNVTFSPTMTLTAVSTTFNFSGSSGATQTFTSAGLSLPVGITVNPTGGGTVVFADDVTMPATQTLTLSSGTLNLNNRTVSVGRFNASGATARALALGTSSVLNITGDNVTVWNAANATNFSYTGVGSVNFTYSGSAGTRGIQHGTTGGGTVATKPPPMYVTGGSDILDPKIAGSWYGDIDYTGYTGVLANLLTNIAGNLILGTGMTANAGANAYTFAGNTTQTIVTNGVTTDFPITIAQPAGGTFSLGEPLAIGNARTLTITAGNLVTNGYNITAGKFAGTGSSTRIINISNSNVTLNSSGVPVWNMTASGNATLQAANSTIIFANSSTTVRSIACGNGLTYGNMVISGANVAQFNFSGSGTFNTISTDKSVNQAIYFDSDTTTTVTNWDIVGTANATVTLSATGVTPFNLVKAGGGTVDVSYHNISYSNASPSNTWYALYTNNNTNGGTNTGWIFELPAATSSNFFLVF
jgi:hypothetical protein